MWMVFIVLLNKVNMIGIGRAIVHQHDLFHYGDIQEGTSSTVQGITQTPVDSFNFSQVFLGLYT